MIKIQLGRGENMHMTNKPSPTAQKFRSIMQKTLRGQNLTKKTAFIGIAVCIFLLYVAPYFYRRLTYSVASTLENCILRRTHQYDRAFNELDAFMFNSFTVNEQRPPLPFVGNGKLGTVVNDNAQLYLFYEVPVTAKEHKKAMEHVEEQLIGLNYNPLIRLKQMSEAGLNEEATVINFREGIVERLYCFQTQSSNCVFINHTVVAHRSRPNVLLQHISLLDDHGGTIPQDVEFHLIEDEATLKKTFTKLSDVDGKLYSVYTSVLDVSDSGFMSVVLTKKSSSNVISRDKHHVDTTTVVMHSEVFKSKLEATISIQQVKLRVVAYMDEVIALTSDELLSEHKSAWKDILHTGLSVMTADDPGIPDPRVINSTLYYVLSSSDSKLHDEGIPQAVRRDLIKRLHTPDFCYQEHPTYHGKRLWREVATVNEIDELQRLWTLTLRKHRCESLVSEGAEGMLQAMLLSFGGFQFTDDDLRLETDAEVLHNDIAFHQLVYRNNSLDIRITRDNADNPNIEITLHEQPKTPLYACEAGCVQTPVKLSTEPQLIPVYVTEPPTPILYISHDKNHLYEIKASTHVRRRLEHAAHMEEIRKGSGLPWIFWLGIGTLIILFHLFLIRLIWKEYYYSSISSSSNQYGRRSRLSS